MKSVLVLGGIGFIGLELAKKLIQKNYKIFIIDNLQRGILDKEAKNILSNPNVTFENIDLTNYNLKNFFVKKNIFFDEIYFFASFVGVKYTQKEPQNVLINNIKMILNVMDFWKDTKSNLVFSSTSEIYSESLQVISNFPIPTPEEIPIAFKALENDRSSYSISKLVGEKIIKTFCKNLNKKASIVRYHNVFGGRMGFEHVIPELSLRLIRKENPFKIYGHNETRAFCYIDDAIEMTILSMEHCNNKGNIFNIGDDRNELTIKLLFKKLIKISNYKPKKVEYLSGQPGSPMRRCPNINKIKSLTKFKLISDLDTNLQISFDWYKNNFPTGIPPR